MTEMSDLCYLRKPRITPWVPDARVPGSNRESHSKWRDTILNLPKVFRVLSAGQRINDATLKTFCLIFDASSQNVLKTIFQD